MKRTRLWLFVAVLPVVGLMWAMKGAASWRPQMFGVQTQAGMVQLSPDGKLLAVMALDGTGQVWDVQAHKPLWKLNGDRFVFSPDGRVIVQLCGVAVKEPIWVYPEKVVFNVREARTGKLIRSFSDPKSRPLLKSSKLFGDIDYIQDHEFFQDGSVFFLATRNYLRKWDVGTGRLLSVKHWRVASKPVEISSLHLSLDTKTVVTALTTTDIKFFDTQTALQSHSFHVPVNEILFLSPDNSIIIVLISSFGGQEYQLLRSNDGQLLWRTNQFPQMSFDGKLVYVSVESGVDVFDAHTGVRLRHLPGPISGAFAPSPDGNWLYEARDGKIWKWRAR